MVYSQSSNNDQEEIKITPDKSKQKNDLKLVKNILKENSSLHKSVESTTKNIVSQNGFVSCNRQNELRSSNRSMSLIMQEKKNKLQKRNSEYTSRPNKRLEKTFEELDSSSTGFNFKNNQIYEDGQEQKQKSIKLRKVKKIK